MALKVPKEALWMTLWLSFAVLIKIISYRGTVERLKSGYFSVMKYFGFIILTRSVVCQKRSLKSSENQFVVKLTWHKCECGTSQPSSNIRIETFPTKMTLGFNNIILHFQFHPTIIPVFSKSTLQNSIKFRNWRRRGMIWYFPLSLKQTKWYTVLSS